LTELRSEASAVADGSTQWGRLLVLGAVKKILYDSDQLTQRAMRGGF
jgi:hypothetical protein